MVTYAFHANDDSDFGPTVPGHRSGEGIGSILPYLENSLKVNPNAGALSLARELRAVSERKKKQAEPTLVAPPAKTLKPRRA